MTIQETAAKNKDYLIKMRRFFHANPELRGKEFQTSAVIKEELDKIGIPWRACGLETGVLATIVGEKPGKTILLRADMDALEVQEETGLPYASKVNGVIHGCGHDCHSAMLLTAAHILNDMKKELCGTVKLAFQPAEEIAAGALSMIENGALENVDGCFAIHVWSSFDKGKVICSPGPVMASAAKFQIDIKGLSGHGATPHLCVDALVAASAVVMNLQAIVSREISPQDSACLTVGSITSGTRFNCVADSAHIEGTTRALDRNVSDTFYERIDRITKDTAHSFRAEAITTYDYLTDPVINHQGMTLLAQKAIHKVVSPEALITCPPISGGEDFAYFMNEVPGTIALLGVRNEACNAVWPQHSNKFCVDEDILLNGAMLYAQIAMDFNSSAEEI